MKKNINGQEIELTTEEENIVLAERQEYSDGAFSRKLNKLRTIRNLLLAETDYLALSDNTMSEAMTNYRQELRDITEGLTTVEDVEAVTFPTKP